MSMTTEASRCDKRDENTRRVMIKKERKKNAFSAGDRDRGGEFSALSKREIEVIDRDQRSSEAHS